MSKEKELKVKKLDSPPEPPPGKAPAGGCHSLLCGAVAQATLILLAVAIAVLLVVVAAIQIREAGRAEGQVTSWSRGLAQAQARRVADQVRMYRGLVERMATDPGLPGLMEARDEAGLKRLAAHLTAMVPEGRGVQFFHRDWEEKALGEGHGGETGFATLELVRQIQREQAPDAQVQQFGKADQHIAFAVALPGDAKGLSWGVMIAAVGTDWLKGALEGPITPGIAFELRQVVAATAQPLATSGGAGVGEPQGAERVPGTIWQVAYWAVNGAAMPSVGLLTWGLVGAGVLVLLGVGLVQLQVLRSRFKGDQAKIITLFESFAAGQRLANVQAAMAEFQGTLDLMVKIGRDAGRKPDKVPPPPASPSDGMLVEEVAGDDPAEQPLPERVKANVPARPAKARPTQHQLPATIFRAYDIRGLVKTELIPEVVYEIGRAVGSAAYEKGQQTVIVARDGRGSGEALSEALMRGLIDSGRDVLDLGMVPTPVLYFATHFLGANTGVVVTGSHNAPEYNGLKVVIDGDALSGEGIQGLRTRIESGALLQGKGVRHSQDLLPDYLKRITDDVQLQRPLKVVVDCGNGVAGLVAPDLLAKLGCEVLELFCDIDDTFPNHHPDPADPKNLDHLIATVRSTQAELGVAFDGDGDRLGVVDSNGKIIWPDRILMLLAQDILARQPGADVIYDVKCSRHLAAEILSHGGRPIMWKTGHSLIKAKMKADGALLAGEMSGHIFIKERWYGFDDALYVMARLLEILAFDTRTSAEVFGDLPESEASTPEITLQVREGEQHAVIDRLRAQGKFPGGKMIQIDGVRVEFEDGWGLVRGSNTSPSLSFRFEADSEAALRRIQGQFKEQLMGVAPGLTLPF